MRRVSGGLGSRKTCVLLFGFTVAVAIACARADEEKPTDEDIWGEYWARFGR